MTPPRVPLMVDLVELRDRMRHFGPVAACAYLALLDHHWSHGSLPDQDDALAAVCRLSVRAFRRVKEQLSILFDTDVDGRWHDAELDRRRARALKTSASNQENGRKGGNARWGAST